MSPVRAQNKFGTVDKFAKDILALSVTSLLKFSLLTGQNV